MSRHSNYSKKEGLDCTSCFMFKLHKAKGPICLYDEKPVQRGYRCSFFGEVKKPVKEAVIEADLFGGDA